MYWKDVIAELLKPEDKLASVIDTYLAIGGVLEARQKLVKGDYFSVEDFDKSLVDTFFTLGHFPFFAAHGQVLRPLMLQAIYSKSENVIEEFFTEAIPCALTIAMPHRQMDYGAIRDTVREKFKRSG